MKLQNLIDKKLDELLAKSAKINRAAIKEAIRDIKLALPDIGNPWWKKLLSKLQKRKIAKLEEMARADSNPLVSVIVSCYNGSKYIEEFAHSLSQQSYQNIEILVIDDASSDNSLALLQQFKLDNMSVYASSCNHGVYWNRNYLLTKARGKYVTFHDIDDVSSADRIAKQVQAFNSDSKMIANICRYNRIDNAGNIIIINAEANRKCYVSLMFERERIMNKIGFFENVRIGADSEYFERIKAVFGKIHIIDEVLYFAKNDAGSLTNNIITGNYSKLAKDGSIISDIGGIRKAYQVKFRKWHQEIKKFKVSPYLAIDNQQENYELAKEIQAKSGDHDVENIIKSC